MNPDSRKRRASLLPLGSEEAEHEDVYGASHFGQFGEYMRRKRTKLQIQNAAIAQSENANNNNIFKGLSIYINGLTEPSVQDLRHLIVRSGGIYQPYLDKKSLVTHVVTCSLTPTKLRKYQNLKVVLPQWIVESVNQGKLLPWRDYRYLPRDRVEGVQEARAEQRTLLSFNVRDDTPKTRTQGQTDNGTSKDNGTSRANTDEPFADIEKALPAPYAAESSNPIAQKVLADPNWRRAHTSAAPDFVEGYYRNSRLHYLSTWKAELRALIAEAQERAEEAEQTTLTTVGRGVSQTVQSVDAVFHSPFSMRGADIGAMRPPLKDLAPVSSEVKVRERDTETMRQRTDDCSDRVIMHCDFDCFFVSAGLTTRPHLRGKPVVVCHSQGTQGGASSTSEVASASYEAREQGVRNGMSLQQARRHCPNVITMPYEFERYRQLSLQFYRILLQHADDVQAVSVDEALIDVSAAVRQLGIKHCPSAPCDHYVAKELAENIRTRVREATGCEVSIGIAHNILLARLATRRAKPAGSFHIPCSKASDGILQFISPLDITDLPGFGHAAKKKASEKLGSSNVEKLREVSKERLCDIFGRANGGTLWGFVRGIDHRPLERDGGRRSVSCEINYGIRFADNDETERFIYQMAKEVKRRLDEIGMLGRLLTLKVLKRSPSAPVEPPKFLGCGKCDSFSKQAQLLGPGGQAMSDDKIIARLSWQLLKSFCFDPRELRGLGIQIQRLEMAMEEGQTETLVRGQTTLLFTKAKSPPGRMPKNILKDTFLSDKRGKNRESTVEVSAERATLDNEEQTITQNLQNLELPSLSQVDQSVYDALPDDIKRELDAEFKRRSALQSSDAGPSRTGSRMDSLQKEKDYNHQTLKRITHQLAPRTARSRLSPEKSNLYQMIKLKATALRVSDVELHSLGLDPDVFHGLPEEVQREQLVRARILKEKGGDLDIQTQKRVLKPRKPPSLPADQRRQLSPPRAKFNGPLVLRQHLKQGERLHLTETHEIQSAIGDWVERYRHWVPKEKDVRFFAKYLIQCVDSAVMGDDGIEKATAVMKWWRILLRRYWGAYEIVEDAALAATQVDHVGEAWWQAFRGVKEQMDTELRKKFGGSISLR